MSAIVTWLNLDGFRSVLGPGRRGADDRWRARRLAVRGRLHGPRAAAVPAAATAAGSPRRCLDSCSSCRSPGRCTFAAPATPTPPPRTPVAPQLAPAQSSARVHMILLDGASLDFIAPNAAGGRFPNFGRLLDSGAVMHLATLRPTQPAPVWTAVATGKLPYKTSVYSAARYVVPGSDQPLDLLPDFCFAQALVRLGLIEEEGRASDAVRARPHLGAAERLRHHGGRHRLAADVSGARRQRLPHQRRVSPSRCGIGDRVDGRAAARVSAGRRRGGAHARGRTPRPDRPRSRSRRSRRPAHGPREGQVTPANRARRRCRGRADRASRSASCGRCSSPPSAIPASMRSDTTILRYALPRAFGDVSDEERLRHGRVLEQYYTYLDGIVGRAMAALGPDDLLLVVSGFGMEPLSLGKRAARARRGRSRVERQPRARARRIRDGVRAPGRAKAIFRARRSSTSRRRCCITSACRSRAIWTASRAPTSLRAASPNSGRLRSSRSTIGEAEVHGFRVGSDRSVAADQSRSSPSCILYSASL